MKALNLIAAVFCLVMLTANADAGCRGRRCRPAANSCQPCQPVSNAVHATGNVIGAPIQAIGGCVGGVCPANACPGGICR